jgi:hypothetical protein
VKPRTKLQQEAIVHNWNKARMKNFEALCLQVGWGYDKRMTNRQIDRISAIRTILDELLENWDKESK